MRQRISRLLVLFCMAHLTAMAEQPKPQLIIWSNSGQKIIYTLNEQVEVSFVGNDLTVKAYDQEVHYNLENTYRFSYGTANDGGTTIAFTGPMETFCPTQDLNFSSVTGLKAYVAREYNEERNVLTMSPIDVVPAGTGVLLVGETGVYQIPGKDIHESYDNLLRGVISPIEISPTEATKTNYILVNGTSGTGFYHLSGSGELAAGKAYLQLPSTAAGSRKTIYIEVNGETTGLSDHELNESNGALYRLDGMKVNSPVKNDIYVKDGKKVVVTKN